jgi:lysophospholipase L1-like esterase
LKTLPFHLFLIVLTGSAFAQFREEPTRYVEQSSDMVVLRGGTNAGGNPAAEPLIVQNGTEGESVVLIRFDLSHFPVEAPPSCVIWLNGEAKGTGGNPSLAVYGVESGWNPSTVTFDTMPKIVRRLADLTLPATLKGGIPLPVTDFVREQVKDGKVSVLVRMRSTPGFSKSLELTRKAALAVSKEGSPGYDLGEALRPIWRGRLMSDETLLPTSYDGKPAEANLAFPASRVLRVRNYALTETYEEGRDFSIEGRTLRLTPASRIPFLSFDQMYHNNRDAKPGVLKASDGTYLTFGEGDWFNSRQLVVTYEHDEPWEGPVPAPALLPGTFARLKAGKPLKLAVFGDSISVGASASGNSSKPPFLPNWAKLLARELATKYGSEITLTNPSLGGMRSDWGRKMAEGLLAHEKPDLVILGFGMNDGGGAVPPDVFAANTRAMMESVRKENPDAEFILLMSFQPNSRWRSLDPMPAYLDALKAMEAPGVAVADVWSPHAYLLKNKTYWDMTSNGVNHPNDFLVRLYAQILLARLGVE